MIRSTAKRLSRLPALALLSVAIVPCIVVALTSMAIDWLATAAMGDDEGGEE